MTRNCFLAADHAIDVGRGVAFLEIVVARQRILEIVDRHGLGFFDLLRRAMTDEDRIAAPLDGDALAFGDRAQIDIDIGERQHRGVGIHLADEGPRRQRDTHGADRAGCDIQKIPPVAVGVFAQWPRSQFPSIAKHSARGGRESRRRNYPLAFVALRLGIV